MKINVYYLTYPHPCIAWPMFKKVEIETAPAKLANAEQGFYDDPVIKQLTEMLKEQAGCEVRIEVVTILK